MQVAGHRGLVGSAIMRALAAAGHTNVITRTHAECDLTDAGAVAALFENERPAHVFLAAARIGSTHVNNTFPGEFIRDNLAIQTNVIHQAWKSGVQRLMFLVSSWSAAAAEGRISSARPAGSDRPALWSGQDRRHRDMLEL